MVPRGTCEGQLGWGVWGAAPTPVGFLLSPEHLCLPPAPCERWGLS